MTADEKIFSGGVAVITGAGSGIGRGLARRCGQIGMTVIVTDIDKVQAEKVAAGIIEAGGKAEASSARPRWSSTSQWVNRLVQRADANCGRHSPKARYRCRQTGN